MNNETSLWIKLRNLLWGTAAGIAVCGIWMLVFAWILVLLRQIPRQALTPMVWIAVLSAAFVSGLVSGILSGRQGFLYGLIGGSLLYVLLFLCGWGWTGGVSAASAVKLGAAALAGLTGGVCGVNRRLKY